MPEQSLREMMQAKRHQPRDHGDRRPPVDRVDDDSAAWPGQSSKCRHRSLGVSHVLCRHSKRDNIEGSSTLKVLDAASNSLMDEVILVDCLVGIDAHEDPTAPREHLRQLSVVRKDMTAGSDIEPGASLRDQPG